jgi:plasmid replication initiation protein
MLRFNAFRLAAPMMSDAFSSVRTLMSGGHAVCRDQRWIKTTSLSLIEVVGF